MAQAQEPADSGEPEVVHSVYTQTSIYVAPDGERFPYFNLIAIMQGGRKINLLFNPALAAGLIQDMGKLFMTMTGAMDAETVESAMDQPIDWDNLPPAPPDPQDKDYTDYGRDDEDPQPPDRYGDR